MSNLQIKETKLNKIYYTKELDKVSKDINLILNKKKIRINAKIIRKIIFIGISNLLVWEYKDIMLNNKKQYSRILKKALEINSVRNSITNSLMLDFKENEVIKKRNVDFTKKDLNWVKYLKKKINE
ncbi:hypothetical protein N8743_02020 [Candidatus Pelagibacter ubique]|nr:hypothetical protein [Candidatus Pelagibacter ubique]